MLIRAAVQCGGILLAAILATSADARAAESNSMKASGIAKPEPSAAAIAYQRKLKEYEGARQKYEDEAAAYWKLIADKRQARNAKRHNAQPLRLDDYVLTQPPVYSGPEKPVDPSGPPTEVSPQPPRYIPVVADFVKAAEEQFGRGPERPKSEIEFKRAYAKVAAAAGLTKDQAVRVYGFEAGGDGAYDVQAGLEKPNPGARASSTALGYNQLLSTNSVELLAEQGDQFLAALKARASPSKKTAKKAWQDKIAMLERMVAFSRTVPDEWSEHEKLARMPQGLGIHAMNLDIDIGPLLQTQKLLDSVLFARRKGFKETLSAAELEMMNLTGDGNGFDMVTMATELRDKVPTSNFFHQGGYERNPVAIRNNVVSQLLAATDAAMDREVKLPGTKDLAAAFR